MVYIKTYMFEHFYQQYLVLLTMAPRNTSPPFSRAEVLAILISKLWMVAVVWKSPFLQEESA